MEESSFRIKRKYVYAGLIFAVLVFGLVAYSLGAKNNNSSARNQANGMVNGDPSSDSMADHHKPAQAKPSGFFGNAVGKQAPDFELQDINGNVVKLSDYEGKNVVLFFNEGSMCYPACWDQMAAFGNDERFNRDDVAALSIVVDSISQWQQILQKVPQMSKSKILFDSIKKVSAEYDVLYTDSSMHKGSYPGHTYFIIDKDMNIRYTFDDPAMAIQNDRIAAEIAKLA